MLILLTKGNKATSFPPFKKVSSSGLKYYQTRIGKRRLLGKPIGKRSCSHLVGPLTIKSSSDAFRVLPGSTYTRSGRVDNFLLHRNFW